MVTNNIMVEISRNYDLRLRENSPNYKRDKTHWKPKDNRREFTNPTQQLTRETVLKETNFKYPIVPIRKKDNSLLEQRTTIMHTDPHKSSPYC